MTVSESEILLEDLRAVRRDINRSFEAAGRRFSNVNRGAFGSLRREYSPHEPALRLMLALAAIVLM